MVKTDQVFIYSDRVAYTRFTEQMQIPLEKIASINSGFYRIEKTFFRSDNDDIGLGYKGVLAFQLASSTRQPSLSCSSLDFFKEA